MQKMKLYGRDKKGVFSVRSAYQLAISISSHSEASGSDPKQAAKLWKKLWGLNILPRAKICVWKFINNILPSCSNLQSKGLDINPCCVLCRKNIESSIHAIWECKMAKKVWINCIPQILMLFQLCKDDWVCLDYWSWCCDNLTNEELGKAALLI